MSQRIFHNDSIADTHPQYERGVGNFDIEFSWVQGYGRVEFQCSVMVVVVMVSLQILIGIEFSVQFYLDCPYIRRI